jgi:hypothetical protein
MRKLVFALFALVFSFPAYGATDVWVFYGAGFYFWSSGMDEIARRATTLSGVGTVHGPYDYRDTQRAYDEIVAAKAADPHLKVVISGYSCGANGSGAVAQGLHRNGISVNLAVIQPSVWCGHSYMRTTSNVRFAQATYGNCIQTLGLGCDQWTGDAYRIVNIYRPDQHLQADTDPDSQRDVLTVIYCTANPDRRGCRPYLRHLHRTTTITRYSGQTGVWHLQER